MKNTITQSELKEILNYSPETGVFTWLVSAGTKKAGDIAGTISSEGYIHISINSKKYSAHRLAFLYMTGSIPEKQIDHICGIRTDNRWDQLREATQNENQKNTNRRKDNSTGFKGVGFHKASKKFRARAALNGITYELGLFVSAIQASEAYKAFARLHHGDFYHD